MRKARRLQAAAPVEAMFRDAVSGNAEFFGSQVRLTVSGAGGCDELSAQVSNDRQR